LNDQINEHSRAIEDLRQGPGAPPADILGEIRDHLATMHGVVDEVVSERESLRRYVRTHVLPHIDEMRTEVRREIDSLPSEDPRRVPLVRTEGVLQVWQANPERIGELLDGRARRAWHEEVSPESTDISPERLLRRQAWLDGQQHRLNLFQTRLDADLERLREQIEALPPEQRVEFERLKATDERPRRRGDNATPEAP
jgi:hypothetical protein